jgi:hypothetical protein
MSRRFPDRVDSALARGTKSTRSGVSAAEAGTDEMAKSEARQFAKIDGLAGGATDGAPIGATR